MVVQLQSIFYLGQVPVWSYFSFFIYFSFRGYLFHLMKLQHAFAVYYFYKTHGSHFLFLSYFSGLKPNLTKSEIVGIRVLKRFQVAICGMHCIDLNNDIVVIYRATWCTLKPKVEKTKKIHPEKILALWLNIFLNFLKKSFTYTSGYRTFPEIELSSSKIKIFLIFPK